MVEWTVVMRCTIACGFHAEPVDTQIAGWALRMVFARALLRVDTNPFFAEMAQRTISLIRTARWGGDAATIKTAFRLSAVTVFGAFFGHLDPAQG